MPLNGTERTRYVNSLTAIFCRVVTLLNLQTGSQSDLSMLWRQAADFHLRGGEPQTAARSLEELLKINPSDMKTLAQLVIAYAQFDPKKAQELSKKLPPVGELAQGTDVDALETSSWVMGTKVIKKVTLKVEASPMTG